MAALLIPVALTTLFLGYKTTKQWTKRLELPRSYCLEIVDAVKRLPDLAPGEAIGITDSGTVGFFCPAPAINLDGVVNPEATRAIKAGELLRYVEEKGIRYLVVTPRMQNARIWGEEFETRLERFPAMTPQGYRVVPGKNAH